MKQRNQVLVFLLEKEKIVGKIQFKIKKGSKSP